MALVRNHPDYNKFRMKIGFMMDFSGSSWVYQEEPTGNMDGKNRIFRLSRKPIENTEEIFKDGMLMARGLDYTIDYTNKQINFQNDGTEEILEGGITKIVEKKGQIPQPRSVIRVNYKYELE